MADQREVLLDLGARRRVRTIGRVPSTPAPVGVSIPGLPSVGLLSSTRAPVIAVTTGGQFLQIPSNAIDVTPSTLADAINSNPGGTNFRLLSGVYVGSFPNKAGNGYYGQNISNPGAVVFDGQTTYSRSDINNDDPNNLATGGALTIMTVAASNTFAHMHWKRYRGADKNQGPLASAGVSGVRIDNVYSYEQQYSGLRFSGSSWEVSNFKGYRNGQYGVNGSGTHLCRNSEFYQNGIEAPSWGIPRWKTSDRGGSKIVLSNGFEFRDIYTHDHEDNGLWYDIGNQNCIFRRVTAINNKRNGIDLEASFGGHLIEDCYVENCAFSTPAESYRHWSILISMSNTTIVRRNQVVGGSGTRNGIGLYQWNHPQLSQGNCTRVYGVTVEDNQTENIKNHYANIASLTSIDGYHATDAGANNIFRRNNYVGVTNTSPSGAFYWKNEAMNYQTWKSKPNLTGD